MAFKNRCNKLICIPTSGNFCYVLYRPYDLNYENEQNLFKKWKTKLNGNNFSKCSLIFAFSTILAGNKYIFTYLISISIQMSQNKYTYWKNVSRRHPDYSWKYKYKLRHWENLWRNYEQLSPQEIETLVRKNILNSLCKPYLHL